MISLSGVEKTYRTGRLAVTALSGVDLEIARGELVAVMGPSGSGKSTLMNIIGCLDRPTAGRYNLAGADVSRLGDRELARLRNRTIGFVFQSFNLLPRLTALENVELPLVYRGMGRGARRAGAREALELVGLADRARHRPSELSGGEQQRVAIARALAQKTPVILADEPTGNLDSRSGEEVIRLFRDLHQHNITVIMVTHDPEVAMVAPRQIGLRDGVLVKDTVAEVTT